MSRPQEVSTDSEEILHDTVNRREPLELSGRLETPHLALTLSSRLMGDLRLTWLVRLRVCRPAVAAGELAAEYHVALDTIRIEVNRLAKSLDLPVCPRGRRRDSSSRADGLPNAS